MARSTFPSQNVQNTPFSDHFWKLRCRKSARGCGTKHISKSKCTRHTFSDHFWKLRCRKSAHCCGMKHISKSKCTKHTILGPLLEVEMSKKCTRLWHEAHFQVKMHKTHTFSDRFWKLRCRKSARCCGTKHISKSKCTKHTIIGPLLEVGMSKKCTRFVARSTFRSENVKNTRVSDHFWTLRCRSAWQVQGIVDLVKSEQSVRVL